MSFLSAMGSNASFHNLTVTGSFTLANEPDIVIPQSLEIENLDVSGDTSLNNLDVSGGTILNSVTAQSLVVSGDTSLNNLDVSGGTILNSVTAQTLDVSGSTVLQGVNMGGPVSINTPQFYIGCNSNGILPVSNTASSAPNCSGVICGNLTNGFSEVDFVNTYEANINTTSPAFSFYKLGVSTEPICGISNNGTFACKAIDTTGIETTTINATGMTTLASAQCSSMLVNGNSTLHNTTVTGTFSVNGVAISGGTQLSQEIVSYGNINVILGSVVSGTGSISNANNVSTYCVFPSVYYTSGSSSVITASQNLDPIIISSQSMNSFNWTMNSTSSGNCNVTLSFLIVYM
jgi:hypothetical protein